MKKKILMESLKKALERSGYVLPPINPENSQEQLSDCLFSDYWENAEIDCSQGKVTKSSVFIRAVIKKPMPGGFSFNKFNHANNLKFIARNLKYFMLSNLVSHIPDELFSHDIDGNYIIEKCKYIAQLCDRAFSEENSDVQKDALIFAVKEFNDFCENYILEKIGIYYLFEVFFEHETAKNTILGFLHTLNEKQRFEKVFSKDKWTVKDKKTIENIVDSII